MQADYSVCSSEAQPLASEVPSRIELLYTVLQTVA